ncbi:hypothetical protein GGS21DRAFT_547675 [Xylaria nigripes]|nr:hypothetical protein GGS21DRAFT_547675 [Xylaria nigripes]
MSKVNGAHSKVYGRRLLPNIVDEVASTDPHREVFSVPRTSNPKDGWRAITYKEYANAINHVAREIMQRCGVPPVGAFPTIAYIGPNDARYVILFLSAAKAGYKAFFISPRNTKEAQLSLFEATDCRVLVLAQSYRKAAEPWLQARDMQVIETSSVESWFPEEEVEHVPYLKTFEEAEWDPICVLHTSGSTGIPKPIVVRAGMIAIGDRYHTKRDRQGRKNFIVDRAEGISRNFLPMPLFHAAGIYSFCSLTLCYGTPAAFGLPDRPLTADSVIECLEQLDVEGMLLPPAILEDLSQNDQYINALTKYKKVSFAGGSLTPETGDMLVQRGIALHSLISSTECFPFPFPAQLNLKLWQYFIIDSEDFGADWRKVEGEDEIYKLVVVRKDTDMQGFFYTFPDKTEHDTGDMFKKHPTLPDHWLYAGRSDNIIVFSNGEKLNPVTIEETVARDHELKGAVVAGAGRFQPCLLLEPTEQPQTENEAKELIERIWPFVVEANKKTVAHGQIARELIMVTSSGKPFLRAGKGTIQKAGTLKLYASEIDELYKKAGEGSIAEAPRLDASSKESLVESIQNLFHNNIGFEGTLERDADFFVSGVDSLQVLNLTRLLRTGLQAAGFQNDQAISPTVIYGNPTSERLAAYIFSVVTEGVGAATNDAAHEIERMKALWEKYTANLPMAKPGRPDPSDEGQVVLITGSTGRLGSYMVDQMVKNPAVKRIISLNRTEDGGKERYAQAVQDRELSTEYESKCTFLRADMSRPDFGLPQKTYSELLRTADRFIHNAWPVNFNIPVESFEPHLRSVRNVGDFASKSAKRVAVVFISSISSTGNWDPKAGPVPETRLDDLTIPSEGGYGKSKVLGSLILEDVARSGDFPAAIIRVGQVGGPEARAGFWNKQEWLPSIIASSLYLGALPKNLGFMDRVDWTAVESIAGLVLDVDGISQKVTADEISGYYHGVNPSATKWAEIAPAVQEFYGKKRIPELVEFKEWVERLDKSSHNGDTNAVDKNPGVKLLDTYRGMSSAVGDVEVVLDMTKTTARSPAMQKAAPVTRELMVRWCQQWNF